MAVLKLAGVASTLYFRESMSRSMNFTLVLPKLPVMPMVMRFGWLRIFCRADLKNPAFTLAS